MNRLGLNLNIFRYSEDMLYEYLYLRFKKRFNRVIRDKDKTYLFVDNQAKVLIVSHLDVVHSWNKYGNSEVYVVKNKYLWSPQGIGGDDRAGVHILYWISNSEYRNKVNYLFTKGEERGCVGARSFNIDYKDKLDLFAMIEFDREGRDFVMYRYRDSEWENYIAKITKRKSGIGSVSDISYLDLGVRGVNIGIGYYHNHSVAEYVVLADMLRAYHDGLALIKDILSKGKKWEYKEDKTRRWSYWGYYDWEYSGRYKSLYDDTDYKDLYATSYIWFKFKMTSSCPYCNKISDLYQSDNGETMCISCLIEFGYDIIYFNQYDTQGYFTGICMLCGKMDKVYINTRDMLIKCSSCDKTVIESLYRKIDNIRVKVKQ